MVSQKLYKKLCFEILISTMHRESLSFMGKMFPHHKLKDLNVLIINQTKKGKELKSVYPNIKVINSYEIGLSKSRNLALENAKGDICLIADDDVEYLPNFEEIVKNAFISLPEASIFRFKIDTFSGEPYKIYNLASKRLKRKKDIEDASSIEIAFKRNDIVSKVSFNTLFGLGSYFKSGEEYLFLRDALKQKKKIYFENISIVKHSFERSTSNIGSDNFVRAKAALYYEDYKGFCYLYLFKFILYLLRKGIITYTQLFYKYKVGVLAIEAYRKLKK